MAIDIDIPDCEPSSTRRVILTRRDGDGTRRIDDAVTVEEPLEIRLGYQLVGQPAERSVSVTMRTPGADHRLALGFLYGEGILDGPDDIAAIDDITDDDGNDDNIVRITVADGVDVDLASLQRNFYTTSSCGVCGKASLQALELDDCTPVNDEMTMGADTVARLPRRLRDAQQLFDKTGGIHAAGLFGAGGELIAAHEDVGRHNAMDKVVGDQLLSAQLPVRNCAVVLSGRASFELLQKALRAHISVVVAVGAPSSLAVELADNFGITLVGFARGDRFNIYTHPRRIS